MSTSSAPQRAAGDQEPLLRGDTSLLRRVVTGPKRTWRRWFPSDETDDGETPATASAQRQTAPQDIETGIRPVASAADEAAAVASHAQSSGRAAAEEDYASSLVPARSFPSDGSASQSTADPSTSSPDVESFPCTPVAAREVEGSSGSGSSSVGLVATLGQLLGLSTPSKPDAAGDCETGETEAEKQAASGRALLRGLSRSSSGSLPMCLICLEPLTAADFTCGEGIALECQCRGEVALRHRSCAVKWSRVKGDVICDICKTQVLNLPMPSPRASSPSASDADASTDEFPDSHLPIGLEGVPGHADLMFDCIRVTWVAMIVCILFFEMNLTTALWSGIAAGLGYTLFVRAIVRNQLAAAAAVAAENNRASSITSSVAAPIVLPPPMLHHVVN